MKTNVKLLFLALLILIVTFFVYQNSFDNDIPKCEGYITNVYLYVLLGLLITCFSILFINKRRFAITTTKSLLSFGFAIVALFAIYTIKPTNVLLNHAMWLLFIISISVPLYTIWKYSSYSGIVTSSLIMTLILVAGLSIIAYTKPEWIKLSWGSTLTVILLVSIMAWLIPLFFEKGIDMKGYYKILSAIFVVIFMMLILYDTKLLKQKALLCTIPDYPKDSLGLFLDIINLFNSITMFRII
jgi:FtsH-binding integral membrane protein